MYAIEMMDAVMVCNTAITTPITWEMTLEKGELVLEGISGGLEPGELLGLHSTWLEGHDQPVLHGAQGSVCPVTLSLWSW